MRASPAITSLVGAALTVALAAGAVEPFPGTLPGVDIAAGLPGGYEPSGAVWHPRLERLLVVSDGGQLSSLDRDGVSVVSWDVPGDLEAVTVADPAGTLVYLGVEHPDAILEFDLAQGAVTRSFDLTGTLVGPDDRGLEALTFVPDPAHPEGGLFLAGLQDDGRVYRFALPIRSSSTSISVQFVSSFAPVVGRDDLSGLDWVASQATLYAAYDATDRLRAMHADGSLIEEWALPGVSQEGLAFAGCELFVAQDGTAEVLRYGFPTDPLDSDLDGRADCLDDCPQVADPEQADADGDGAGDACDCAPAEPSASAPPDEVSGLVLAHQFGLTSLAWDAAGTLHDVAWGTGSELRLDGDLHSAACLQDAIDGSSLLDPTPTPLAGDMNYFLVRAENACGPGSYGVSTTGIPRSLPGACP